MANRPQSRYQIGLPYDPAMAAGGYRPERVSVGEIGPGDYGVTPIPLPNTDGGGVVAPLATEGGSGLGGAGLGALSLLANPNLLTQARDLYNRVTKTPGGAFPAGSIDGLGNPLTPTGQQVMPGGGSGGYTPTVDAAGNLIDPLGETADKLPGFLGGDGLGTWQEGVFGSGTGQGGLFGNGGFTAVPYGSGAVPWEGVLGGMDLGGLGTLDFASSGLGMLGGALGNYMVSQSPYAGGRDPTGRDIGGQIGSVIGGILGGPLAPITAFLGAQFGGMIGGQFGPDMSTGPIYASDIAYRNGQWQTNAHADNGAQVNPALGEGFLQGLQSYMAANGYEMAPGVDYRFVIGNTRGGEDTDAYGSGFYINPNPISGAGEGPASQMYFGTDLAANWQTPYEAMTAAAPGAGSQYWDPNIGLDQFAQSINPDSLTGDAMLQYVFNYMNNYGLVQPIGGAPRPQPMGNTGNPTEQAMG